MSRREVVRRALRHRDGEPVFGEQWHAQVIAVVELLVADGKIDPAEWSDTLGSELEMRACDDVSGDDAIYYSAFLSTLERLLDRDEIALQPEVNKRESDWRKAYLSTPHGEPVILND